MGYKPIVLEKGPLSEKVNDYIHAMFWLSRKPFSAKATKGAMMGFSDLRKFGKILAASKKDFPNLEDVKKFFHEDFIVLPYPLRGWEYAVKRHMKC